MPREKFKLWIGKNDRAVAPENVPIAIRPLSRDEKGRGMRLAPERLREIRRETMRLVADGYRQMDIAAALNASRSRLSRWCRQEIIETMAPMRLIAHSDRTLTQARWDRIDVGGPHECWNWMGSLRDNGYGSLNFRGKGHTAHRLVYETLVGQIPEGRVIDHTCSNPRCVNPRHLQVVTQTENLMLSSRRRA